MSLAEFPETTVPTIQESEHEMNENLILVTDERGSPVLDGDEGHEPLPGSVVLTEGEFGTAWQRYFSDGRWHRVGGGSARGKPWSYFLTKRNVVLVYDAHERVGA